MNSLSCPVAVFLVAVLPVAPLAAEPDKAVRVVRVVEDFGARCDGVADDAIAINSASEAIGKVGGGEVRFPANATCNIGAPIVMRSNVVYRGADGSVVRGAVADIDEFQGYGVTNVTVRDVKITNSETYHGGSKTNPHPSGINLYASNQCLVSNVEMSNISFVGVYLADTSHCRIEKLYAHDWAPNDPKEVGNPSDVALMLNSNDNIVENSELSGGGWHGVTIMNPYAEHANPRRNIVRNNHIGRHTGYGVVIYVPYPEADNLSEVTDNAIEHIEGSVIGNSSGACIYVVGGGGVTIARNRISDCSAQSNNLTLTPGGVGINGIAEWMKPVRIIENRIFDITRYSGIYVASSPGGAVVIGNAIRMPRKNSGGAGIAAVNANKLIFERNRIDIQGAAPYIAGVQIIASSKDVKDIKIVRNTIVGAAHSCVITEQAGDARLFDFEIRGNTCEAGAITNVGLRLVNLTIANISENKFSGPGEGLAQTNGIQVRYSRNEFNSPNAILRYHGKNDGSIFERTNHHSSVIINDGTGVVFEEFLPREQ